MILKITIFLLSISSALKCISGASYPQVYVRSGSKLVPLEYIQYGVPSVPLAESQIAQISTNPIEQVVSVPSTPGIIVPCSTPCVYSGQIVSAPLPQTSTNVITYKSNVPVVMPSKEEETGYEYSYMVYDKNTGDQKSQYELSDGSIVRGEYSFVQPDGYIREVSYVADDTKGFHAIVNYLPESKEKKKELNENIVQAIPSSDIKNDSSKISNDIKQMSMEGTDEKYSAVTLDLNKESNEKADIKESDKNNISQKYIENIGKSENNLIPLEETKNNLEIEALTESSPRNYKAEETSPDSEPTETTTVIIPSVEDKLSSSNIANKDAVQDTNTQVAVVEAETSTQQNLETSDILVSYNDILKCVQTTINGATKATSVPKSQSPLTYIIFNKPC